MKIPTRTKLLTKEQNAFLREFYIKSTITCPICNEKFKLHKSLAFFGQVKRYKEHLVWRHDYPFEILIADDFTILETDDLKKAEALEAYIGVMQNLAKTQNAMKRLIRSENIK